MKHKILAMVLVLAMLMSVAYVFAEGTEQEMVEGASSPNWLAGNRVLLSAAGDDGAAYYTYSNFSKNYIKLIDEKANAVEVAVSHDGVYVAYVDDQGAVYVTNTFNERTNQISKDTTSKSELQWGAKDDKLYYIAGDKSNIIAQMNVTDGKITVLNDDKVEYKSDLSVSPDGSKLVYAVTKTAVFSETSDSMKVDTTGTEPQIFLLDLSVSGPKPVQLTNDKELKSSIQLLQDGKVIYVGAEATENSAFGLKILGNQGRTLNLVYDLNAMHVQVLGDGRVFALGTTANTKAIYEINPDTAKKVPVAIIDDSVTDFVMSQDGTQILVTASNEAGESIYLLERVMTRITN